MSSPNGDDRHRFDEPGTSDLLSVVVIAKNQDWNVEYLLASIDEATVSFGGPVPVVLVDSASTDDTANLARSCGADVLVLSDQQRLTAAAGRHVGFQHTGGEFVLFLDGDMEVFPRWLRHGISLLESDPSVAVVGGRRIDLPVDTERIGPPPDDDSDGEVVAEDITHAGGAAIYRRSVLEDVGGFNPFVYSDEEPELCLRIRRAGYRVVRLDTLAVRHYTDPTDRLSTLVARSKRNLYVGAGQNLRLLAGTDGFWPYMRERGFGLGPIAWGVVGAVLGVASARRADPRPLGAWVLATGAGFGALAVRKRSIYRAAHTFLRRWLIAVGTVRGFAMTPHETAEYPAMLDEPRPINGAEGSGDD